MLSTARSPTLSALLLLLAAVFSPAAVGGEEIVTLTLSAALRTALANNLDLADAALETAKSEKERAIADSRRQPEISLGASYTRLEEPETADIPIPGFSLPDSEADLALKASVPLYTGGRLRSARESAARGLDLARESERQARVDLLLQTAVAFYELFAGEQFVAITEESLANSRRHLADVEALLAQGQVAKVDLYRTEFDVAQRERDLAAAEANHVRRAEHLASLLFPDRLVTLRAVWEPPEPAALPPVEEWSELALKSSPEMRAAGITLDLARSGVEAARAERRPAVGLFGDYGARDEQPSVSTEDRYWHTGVALSLPLYTGGRTGLEIEKSLDTETQASHGIVRTRRRLRRAIVEAHADTRLAHRQHAAALKAITAATENHRVTDLKYRQGLIPNIDVIDALLSLARARFDLVQALKDYHSGRALLMRLTGTIEELQ